MGLTISALVEETSAYVIAKDRLWLTADRDRLVVEGDRAAAFLFATPGHRISKADAERYGLLGESDPTAPLQGMEVPDGGPIEDAEAQPLDLSDEERDALPAIEASEDAEAPPPPKRSTRRRSKKGS